MTLFLKTKHSLARGDIYSISGFTFGVYDNMLQRKNIMFSFAIIFIYILALNFKVICANVCVTAK